MNSQYKAVKVFLITVNLHSNFLDFYQFLFYFQAVDTNLIRSMCDTVQLTTDLKTAKTLHVSRTIMDISKETFVN